MHVCESFDLPGLSAPDSVCENLKLTPRTLTLACFNVDFILRSLFYIAELCAASIAVTKLFSFGAELSSLWAWGAVFAIIPIALVFIPWKLIHGFLAQKRCFEACKHVYTNGVPVIGCIVMMSFVSGNDYSSYFNKHGLRHPFSKRRVRIDYSFYIENTLESGEVENVLKTGSVFIHERNARFLALNDPVCVLYDPQNPAKNMLFPIPGEEFCSGCLK